MKDLEDIEVTTIEGVEEIRIGFYEPGNETSYKAIAVPFHYDDDRHLNALGRISVGWLVINCNTRLAYLFRRRGLLHDDYIMEKLGGTKEDYPYFGDLVRRLIDREA